MTKITIIGAAELHVVGVGVIQLESRDATPLNSETVVTVEKLAHLEIDGQVIANFSGQGSFIADGVRVICNGDVCVNMVSQGNVYTGGPGLVFAEGCCVRADYKQTVIALNCPLAHVHDTATLIATGCEEVSAYGRATLNASHCNHVLAVEKATLTAADCGIVRVDQGFDSVKPTVKINRCQTVIPVRHDFGFDDDGCVEEIYVDADSSIAA